MEDLIMWIVRSTTFLQKHSESILWVTETSGWSSRDHKKTKQFSGKQFTASDCSSEEQTVESRNNDYFKALQSMRCQAAPIQNNWEKESTNVIISIFAASMKVSEFNSPMLFWCKNTIHQHYKPRSEHGSLYSRLGFRQNMDRAPPSFSSRAVTCSAAHF